MDIFNVLLGSFIKLSSRRSIPIEQIRGANFVRSFSDQDDFTISFNTNMSANNVLTDRRSYSCSIPRLSCFDNIPNNFNTLLGSKIDLSMNRFDVVSNHLGIFKISSTNHSAAKGLNR